MISPSKTLSWEGCTEDCKLGKEGGEKDLYVVLIFSIYCQLQL